MKEGELLRQSLTDITPKGGDLLTQATELGFIHAFTEGQWFYSGPWVEIFRSLQALYVSRVCQRLHFEEWMFPRLLPKRTLESFELTHYKPGMLFGVGPYEEIREYSQVLDPVQCAPLYQYLQGRLIHLNVLPLKIIECLGGWTWRNEQTENLLGPIRAREFARIESVYIGTPEDVRILRNLVEEQITELLSELSLSWRIVVGAGCMEIPSLLQATEKATTADQVPVHDVEILLEGGKWLEISGCTVEREHLIEAFSIQRQDGEILWSGCCGLGMNRLLSGLFLQHGFELSKWPESVKRLLELELPYPVL